MFNYSLKKPPASQPFSFAAKLTDLLAIPTIVPEDGNYFDEYDFSALGAEVEK